jgi:TetR/AcrR family transcriptional regulator, regulator of autoinduction and epiphytic fitness
LMSDRSDASDAADSSRSIGASSDRRLARGNHTHAILTEAMIELIIEGNPRPTAGQVADRAGTSVRTVFNHFHIDALFGHAAGALIARHLALVTMVPPRGPVKARIQATCHQRRQFFEAVAPLIRVAHIRVGSSPGLNQALRALESFLQGQLTVTFGPEISSDGRDGALLLEELDLITGWPTWYLLRSRPLRSATAAEQAMAVFVTRLLVHPISGSPTKASR